MYLIEQLTKLQLNINYEGPVKQPNSHDTWHFHRMKKIFVYCHRPNLNCSQGLKMDWWCCNTRRLQALLIKDKICLPSKAHYGEQGEAFQVSTHLNKHKTPLGSKPAFIYTLRIWYLIKMMPNDSYFRHTFAHTRAHVCVAILVGTF